MPGQPNLVKTRLECGRCGFALTLCVPVRTGVHPLLRCDHAAHGNPGGGTGGAGMLCPHVADRSLLTGDRLTALVEAVMPRRLREWKRLGVVVVPCDAA